MKAIILNSGIGKRMGVTTSDNPKCLTEINFSETILSRQLHSLAQLGITEVVITTGAFSDKLINYCRLIAPNMDITFVHNKDFASTNYIYSIYLSRLHLNDDILLIHGDLVFENSVLEQALAFGGSCMVVDKRRTLPDKDFKAVIINDKVTSIGIEFFANAVAAQPLYKLAKSDWLIWLDKIIEFCEADNTNCYAEDAFNDISSQINLYALNVDGMLCSEIDTPEDLAVVSAKVNEIKNRTVYMSFSTEIIHSGHLDIIKKAQKLGKLIIGVLSDNVVASFKRFPLIPFDERKSLFENINGVFKVVEQKTLSYADILKELKPTYVVHGDDWKTGFQKPIRDEVVSILAEYGGQLVEFPYSKDSKYKAIEQQYQTKLSIPDVRRGRLRRLLELKPTLSIIEAHNGITGLIAEKTIAYQEGKPYQFDGIWISSLCDSTAKGKPDIELVDMTSRLRTIDDIMEVTTKPIILDGDTGGLIEHFVYNVKTLERIGVSAIIIEDKTGLKKNSLFGTDVVQTQDSIENFCAKISAGKQAKRTEDFMIIARIESLILEQGMEDALKRAFAYVSAGADGIMIHSRKKEPDEIFEFAHRFREKDCFSTLVVVPTSFNTVTEEEFSKRGINIVIYANQLIRSSFPAMQRTAHTILENHRAKEADDLCMSIKDILTLIPQE